MKIRGRDIIACALAGFVAYGAAVASEVNDVGAAAANPGLPSLVSSGRATAAASGIQAETLLKSDSSWDGTPYSAYPPGRPELTVVRLTIAPHTSLPWHTHPMPNAAYVVSGTLTVEKQSDGTRRELSAGQVLAEMVNIPHRGITGDEPVVLIVFYAGTPDLPLSEGH